MIRVTDRAGEMRFNCTRETGWIQIFEIPYFWKFPFNCLHSTVDGDRLKSPADRESPVTTEVTHGP